MERLPIRSPALKFGFLILVIFYYLYPAININKSASVSRAQSPIAQHLNTRGRSPFADAIDRYHKAGRAVNAAKLLLRPHHPRSLIAQGDTKKSGAEDILSQRIRSFPNALLHDIDAHTTLEECLDFLGPVIGEQHAQPRADKSLKTGYLEDGLVKKDGLRPRGNVVYDHLYGLMSLLGRFEKQQNSTAKIDTLGNTKAVVGPDDLAKLSRPILDHLLNAIGVGLHFTVDECLQLMKPILWEPLLNYAGEYDRQRGEASEISVQRQSRDRRCNKQPSARRCRGPANYSSHAPYVVEHRNFPRWQNSTQNGTTTCNPLDHHRFPNSTIESRMSDHCTPKGHKTRTWIDEVLPPQECAKYPRGSADLKRCLSISEEISPWAIGAWVFLGVLVASTIGLVTLACIRGKNLTLVPDPNPFNRFPAPKYSQTRRIHGVGFDGGSSRCNDIPPHHDPGTTLDGANDGWTKWISRRTHKEKQRSCVPPSRTPAPRLPSLKLPKPTFATVRRAGGLEPDLYPGYKSRRSKQTSKLLRWGSNF